MSSLTNFFIFKLMAFL